MPHPGEDALYERFVDADEFRACSRPELTVKDALALLWRLEARSSRPVPRAVVPELDEADDDLCDAVALKALSRATLPVDPKLGECALIDRALRTVDATGAKRPLAQRLVELAVELRRCRQSRRDPASLFPVYADHARRALDACDDLAKTFEHRLATFDAAAVLGRARTELDGYARIARSNDVIVVLEDAIMTEAKAPGTIRDALDGLRDDVLAGLEPHAQDLVDKASNYADLVEPKPEPDEPLGHLDALRRTASNGVHAVPPAAVADGALHDAPAAVVAAAPPPLDVRGNVDVRGAIDRIADADVKVKVTSLFDRLQHVEGLLAPPQGPLTPNGAPPPPLDVRGAIGRIADADVKAKVTSLFDRLEHVEGILPAPADSEARP